jgi:hypothetical protein
MKGANLLATLRLSVTTALHTTIGRLLGRSNVPHPRTYMFIEPTSHCNLECSFCTYRLGLRPRRVMETGRFRDYVGQALAMGFADIVLTPINGDVFMDKSILDKLRLLAAALDGQAGSGAGILLYTNLIGADAAQLDEILSMPRLKLFVVSLYGHDLQTFERITGRGESQFRRLLDNLATLEAMVRARGALPGLSLCMRSERGYGLDARLDGPLHAILRRLAALGVPVVVQNDLDDWGGLVSEADLGGLDMRLIQGRLVPKNGACIQPFYNVQILADGRVNACACRAVRDDLIIGDLNHDSLSTILSADNPAYTGLIERQEAGDFPESCRGCSFYRSIYDGRIRGASGLGWISLDEFRRFIAAPSTAPFPQGKPAPGG